MSAGSSKWNFVGMAGEYRVWHDAEQDIHQVSTGPAPESNGGYGNRDTLLAMKGLRPHDFVEGKRTLTILVHPGSACGSANSNLGRSQARAGRDGLMVDLQDADGDFCVIDGSYSDELKYYPELNDAITKSINEARSRKHMGRRIRGSDDEDYDQVAAARDLIAEEQLSPDTHTVQITGAWFDPEGDEGCVNSVAEVFEKAGFSVRIMDFALQLDEPTHDEDCEGEEYPRP